MLPTNVRAPRSTTIVNLHNKTKGIVISRFKFAELLFEKEDTYSIVPIWKRPDSDVGQVIACPVCRQSKFSARVALYDQYCR